MESRSSRTNDFCRACIFSIHRCLCIRRRWQHLADPRRVGRPENGDLLAQPNKTDATRSRSASGGEGRMVELITFPPCSQIELVTDILHGVPVTDPYRWLENQDSLQT